MFDSVAVRVDHLDEAVVAQPFHFVHLVAFRERGVGGHDETTALSQLVDHVLLHAEVLHEGEVGPIHRLGSDADLVCLAYESIAMLVGRDIVLSVRTMRVDVHVV